MEAMFCRALPRVAVLAACVGLFAISFCAGAQDTDKRGRKYKAPPATATIAVTILRNFDGKPIENAAVVFHPMEGEKDKGAMELKTNEDGKTTIDVIPIGDVVRLQVIAKGYQTYGEDYKIDKANMAFEIRMKRPGEQYSIYKPHPGNGDPNQGQGKETDNNPQANASPSGASGSTGSDSASTPPSKDANAKDSGKDKSTGSSTQSPSQPSQPQSQPN
jgi:5-hydroxyisourate hydrolase-like protein (transthyretin family)